MTRLFRHDEDFTIRRVQEILHTADDPAKIMRLMIAELEGALAEARTIASGRLADRHSWRRRLAEARFRHETWGEKADVALAAGREDLARAALVEKHKALDEATALAGQATLIEEIIRDSDEEIAKIQYLVRDLKARQTLHRKRISIH